MFCMHCGKEIPDGAAFCSACGKPVAPAPVPKPAETTSAAFSVEAVPETAAADAPVQAPEIAPSEIPADVPAETPAEAAVQPPLPADVPGQAAASAPPVPDAPAPKKKSRLPLILGIAAAVIALIAGTVLLITGLRNRSAGAGPAPDGAPSLPESEASAPAEAEAPGIGSGERFYTGSTSGEDLGGITVSFVLGEDRDEIHDMKIQIRDFKGKTSYVTVELTGATQTISGSYPVDYTGENRDISIGKNVIEELRFREDGSAYLRFTFTFYQVGIGATPTIEIPVPGLEFEMSSVPGTGEAESGDTAAAPAEAEASEEAAEEEEAEEPSADGEETEPAEEETAADVPRYDEPFDTARLINWCDPIRLDDLGVDSLSDFVPADPQPRYYIVYAPEIIDPVTGAVSEGGRESSSHREYPIDTYALMVRSGKIEGGSLILTDDPNLASYVLFLDFSYSRSTGSFTFSDDSSVPQYNGSLYATLMNLVTGETVGTEEIIAYATVPGENVAGEMLENARGKQLYGSSPLLTADDFDRLEAFLDRGDLSAAEHSSTGAELTAFTIPAYLMDATDPDTAAETLLNGHNYLDTEMNPDGSCTVTLTKAQQAAGMAYIAASADETADLFNELFESAATLTRNDDLTEFRLIVDKPDDDEFMEAFADVMGSFGLSYALIDNRPDAAVRIVVEDRSTGEILMEKTVTDLNSLFAE